MPLHRTWNNQFASTIRIIISTEKRAARLGSPFSFGGTMSRQKAHVYLIHFEHKYHHAGHYLGYSKHLWFRINTHRSNMGAKLLRAVNQAGIDWRVVRTWAVHSQELERKLKSLKNSPRLCPICNPGLQGQVQNEYALMQWEMDQSVYNPNLPLPW
jgi:predicted GIY-YIG superfamily endonuclease